MRKQAKIENVQVIRDEDFLLHWRPWDFAAALIINLYGEYDFSDETLRDSIKFEFPKLKELKVG